MKRIPRTLSAVEIRVLGALLEKEQATPDYYPMTVNAVAHACNQKTNRDPVVNLSGEEVQAALDQLFNEDVLAWRSRVGRSTKWKQNVDRRWQLQPATKAVMTLLLLRGPQTPGELRARGDRLHAFADLGAVEQALSSLSQGDEPLVTELGRQPGQKENRWAHTVGDSAPEAAGSAQPPAVASLAAASSVTPLPGGEHQPDRLDRLEARVAWLEEIVESLTSPDRRDDS